MSARNQEMRPFVAPQVRTPDYGFQSGRGLVSAHGPVIGPRFMLTITTAAEPVVPPPPPPTPDPRYLHDVAGICLQFGNRRRAELLSRQAEELREGTQ
jgi:hypothetical protein